MKIIRFLTDAGAEGLGCLHADDSVTRLDGDQATIQVDEELARLLGLADD